MSVLPNIDDEDYLIARQKIIDDFTKSVYGNDWQSDRLLQLEFDPMYQFTSGVLFPQNKNFEASLTINEEEDYEDIQEEQDINSVSLQKSKPDPDDDDEETNNDLDVIDLSTQYRPSALGITFIANLNEKLEVSFGYSKYIKDSISKKWNQIKSHHELTINLSEEGNKDEYFEDKLLRFNLRKKIKNDQVIVSISLCNQNIIIGDEIHTTENSFFNVGIKVKSLNESFQPIKPALQSASGKQQDSLELLFRKKQSFSSGKGCATDWLLNDDGTCREIWTTFIPEYELENISAKSDEALRMSEFCDIDNNNSQNRLDKILDLSRNYKAWLDNLINESNTLNSKERETADRHFNSIEEYQKRIDAGIDLIQNNKDVENAFRLTNLAMLIQFNRGKNLKTKEPSDELNCDNKEILENLSVNNFNNLDGSWRPFQLAFLLACIPDIFEPDNEKNYRDIVDLIWFPTGGGKTEAYLAVLAFVIILRRIKDPEDIGVSAIMRYTLRLLTSDQFRRSSGLICALEFIRKESIFGINLGTEEISIGLWIGQTASPKNDTKAKEWLNNREFKDKRGRYKFILNQCPWCKSDLNQPENAGYEVRPKGRKQKVIIFCPDKKCFFHESLPIYLWQESIWDKKPSLVLSTVDSFAKLTWYKEAISLFSNEFSPPELIIQDELHLISGPLGTIMGLYEVALLKLLTRENKRPKIIGASATLTFSDQQSTNLYMGRASSIFPPQGLNWGDSFFAQELPLEEKPGRVYLGYFGSVKGSMVESAISGAIPLLQSPMQKRPYLIEDAKKGDLEIIVNEQENLREGNTFSIFHSSEMTNYKISKINDYNERKDDFADAKIISLEDPIITNINSRKSFKSGQKEIRETLFPEYTEIDTSFDPYGTLVWYFNSKRELAYMSNQMIRLRDILEGDAKKINKGNLGTDLSDTTFARKIFEYEELTGRLTQDEIETIVNKLNKNWTQSREYGGDYFKGIDILLATNMISVGVDISRLGLMLVHGHPRSTAEYIQCTSRVGRVHPGLVVTVYNHNKSKDRSIYELFKNYHQSFYRFVEGVSITPFSLGSIKRALPAVFVALIRSYDEIEDPNIRGRDTIINEVKEWILNAVIAIDSTEYNDVNSMLDNIIEKWKNSDPSDWGAMSQKNSEAQRLLSSKSDRNTTFDEVPTSLRNTAEEVQIKLKGN